jgi:hypothetical protein
MAKTPFIFQQIARTGRAVGITPNTTRKSHEWFRRMASEVPAEQVDLEKMHGTKSRLQRTIRGDDIGSMFHFWYDAKHKDKLPYWDRHPLLIPLEIYGDGFLGLNMHYISPTARARLFDALYSQAQFDDDGRPTRLDLSYYTVKGLSETAWYKPCVKRYLRTHVRSSFYWIRPQEWDMALMLPTAQWVGAAQKTIHRKSSRMF